MPFASATDVTLHYNVAGEGPPVCLINGYRQNSASWPTEFIDHLATRCRVVTFDNRGTGLSDRPAHGYEFGHQADDVAGLLDHLQIREVNLLGYSMGGAIAQEVAIRYPERVGRLILFATFGGGIWAEPASWSVLRRLFATDGLGPQEAARQAWPVTYSPEYLAANAQAVEEQMRREVAHPTPAFVCRRQAEAIRRFDRHRDLPRIRARTLVATGTDDLLVKPRNSAILARRIPDARLERLAGLGHRAIWEAPEEVANLIADFVCKSPATTGQGYASQKV